MSAPTTRVARDELARRVAFIHAQLWVADETRDDTRAALRIADDELGVLVRDVGDDDVASELVRARTLAASHLAATIDLREPGVVAERGDQVLRRGRTGVEESLSAVLLGLIQEHP